MKDIAKFMLEVGALKHLKRTGWHVAGVSNPESVAEHKMRAIIIGFILAKLERADENKVVKMLMLHDVPETRIGDLNRITKGYINIEEAEEKVVEDQAKLLPKGIGNEFISLVKEFNEKKTKESIVAKDADALELAVQAHEYILMGYKAAEDLLKRSKARLKTESAKKILEDVLKSDLWWVDLKRPE